MKLQELTNSILTPIFFDYQVYRLFSQESQENINVQLSRFEKRGEIVRLKRGVYKISTKIINEYYLSNLLYQPSYVSLESALNYYGIIPDVSINVTAISVTNSKKVSNTEGVFIYSKINNEMFFGWTVVKVDENIFYKIATPEKALLDYIYIRKIKDINSARVDMSLVDILELNKIIKFYPRWVGKVFHE